MSCQGAYDTKRDILSLRQGELRDILLEYGEKGFRASQIFKWLHQKRVKDFDSMTNLSEELRKRLSNEFRIMSVNPVKRLSSRIDGTEKLLYELEDGNHIETVIMSYEHGDSLCVSTQVGCRMGCRFCASTIAGFKRNLAPSEILLQLYETERLTGRKVSSIVLMGIGEPLDNYENVTAFMDILSSPEGAGMSLRHLSLSTCGLVERIYELAELKSQLTLSISLHASNDETRSRLMPINNKYGLDELMRACRHYFDVTGRRISFEYALIDGENDTKSDALGLSSLIRGMPAHVNIIPVNKIKERDYSSSRQSAAAFCRMLTELGINATVRRTLGSDIDAACGQLRREYEI